MRVIFLAEIIHRAYVDINPTPLNPSAVEGVTITRHKNIYYLDISLPPPSSYWIRWGGRYDHFTDTDISLYYERFLSKCSSLGDVLITPFSFYITEEDKTYGETGDIYTWRRVIMNVPRHPWLYPEYTTSVNTVNPFLSAPLDSKNPSNNIVRSVNAPVIFETPSLNVKLSDNISGVVLNQGFSINLFNNNGYFDDDAKWNLFNTPVNIKKAVAENTPGFGDFKTIRSGLADSTKTDMEVFSVDASDSLSNFDNPVCERVSQSGYLFRIDEGALNKNIPIVYGTANVKLIKLDGERYIAAEKVSRIHGVYNSYGEPLGCDVNAQGIIAVTDGEADSALITGYTNNKIGEIIQDLMLRKAGVNIIDSHWNLIELNEYTAASPGVNFVIHDGSVTKAMQDVLKNDAAFLIQQSDGRFTVRKYGQVYNPKNIKTWTMTKPPEKSWDSAKNNYFSSCVINYGGGKSYFYNERERNAERSYRRKVTRTFDTDLISGTDAANLAMSLSDRYTAMRQTIKLAVGQDVSGFELLDTVYTQVTVNNRRLSRANAFFVKEIDPAQDILTLEEISPVRISGEWPATVNYTDRYDGLRAGSRESDYEQKITGGVA